MLKPAFDPLIRMPALLGVALRPLPLLPLQIALQGLVSVIARRHPELHDRLQAFQGCSIGIAPSDLPFAMLLEPSHRGITLRVVRQLDRETPAARIRGPLLPLLALVNGTHDADALFFSRDITIEGNVEAALALRNAIDDAEIDLVGEVAACVASLVHPVRHAARLLAGCTAVLTRRQWTAR